MDTVLLCLLSAQHVPNLLSVLEVRPDQLVLIESIRMRDKNTAARFRDALEASGHADLAAHTTTLACADAEDVSAIRETLRQALALAPNARWVVNVTGGTKLMALEAVRVFEAALGGPERLSVWYTGIQSPREAVDLASGARQRLEQALPFEAFLRGYGWSVKPPLTRALDQRWRKVFPQASSDAVGTMLVALGQAVDDPALEAALGFLGQFRDAKKAGYTAADLEAQPWRVGVSTVREALPALVPEVRVDGETVRGELRRRQVEWFVSAWLEHLVFGLLDRHREALGLGDLATGVELQPLAGSGVGRHSFSNEIDVAVLTARVAFVAIECKAYWGAVEELSSPNEILYKVFSVSQQIRALRARSVLVTTDRRMTDDAGVLKPSIKERASAYKIRLVTRSDVAALARDADEPKIVGRLLGVEA